MKALWAVLAATIIALASSTPARALQNETGGNRWIAQDGRLLPFADDEAALDFLRTADVVERKTIDTGVTRPARLVLEKDGVRARAIFHNVDVVKDRNRLRSGEVVIFFRDTYRNNVAAYELSRMLGIASVPPAVTRHIGRDEGSVQLWIEQAYTETERREREGAKAMSVLARRSIADMSVFDNLINNIDRNQSNMLHDSAGGFWWIDHTRAFSRARDLPSPDRVRRCSRSLLAALRALKQEEVSERLAPYLSSFEIEALFVRRRKLLDLIDGLIRSKGGERAVLFSYD